MATTAPTAYILVPGPANAPDLAALALADSNGSLASVTTPWLLNSSGIYIPWPVTADGTPEVQLTGSLPGGSNLLGLIGSEIYDGNQWVALKSASALVDADAGDYSAAASPRLWNGSSYDRLYNNTQGTLLASATRTTSTASPLMTNFNAKGVQVQLTITGVPSTPSTGTGLAVVVRGQDVNGNAYNLNVTPSNVTAGGEYVYIIYPDSSGTTVQIQQSTSQALPRSWDVVVVVSTSDSYTYSLNYSLIN